MRLTRTHEYRGTYYTPETPWDEVPEPVQKADRKLSGTERETPQMLQREASVLMLEDTPDFPHAKQLMAHQPPILSVQQAQGMPDHLLLKIKGIGEVGLNAIKNWTPESE